MVGVWGLGFRVWLGEFRVWDLGFRVWFRDCRVWDVEFRAWFRDFVIQSLAYDAESGQGWGLGTMWFRCFRFDCLRNSVLASMRNKNS